MTKYIKLCIAIIITCMNFACGNFVGKIIGLKNIYHSPVKSIAIVAKGVYPKFVIAPLDKYTGPLKGSRASDNFPGLKWQHIDKKLLASIDISDLVKLGEGGISLRGEFFKIDSIKIEKIYQTLSLSGGILIICDFKTHFWNDFNFGAIYLPFEEGEILYDQLPFKVQFDVDIYYY